MVKAVPGMFFTARCCEGRLTQQTGTLVKCDPSIKALILEIDRREGNEYVIEDLGDEEHLLVKDVKIERLKHRVHEVKALHYRLRRG